MARFSILNKYDFKHKVFISYSEVDFWIADLLHKYLVGEIYYLERSFTPFYGGSIFRDRSRDLVKINPSTRFIVYSFLHSKPLSGTHFPTVIKQEIDKAKFLILLLSSTSDKSKWVNYEIEYALKNNKIILPVLLEKSAIIPYGLKSRQAVLAYKNPQKWIIDLKEAIEEISKLKVSDRLDFDKKTGKSISLKESVQVLFRDIYGFDIFNL